ncbi:MAG TPA: DUF2336 domain-containing protein, partial [Verrucomicrobiae bacterium]|nr:DUF2336 domain-containing protein [Verrucomicrobiae bacterium]
MGDNDKRRELAREVANLFFAAEQKGFEHQQVDEFGNIMCRLLDNLDVGERVDLSARMAETERAPRVLAVKLANDEIEVATPMIEQSTVLTEDDLVAIADSKGTSHRVAVSRRENLTAKITDTLISHEESEVMRTVAENRTAEISEGGFSTLARHSTDDNELLTALVTRADVPEEHSRQLLPLLNEEQRAKVVSIVSSNGGSALRELASEAKTRSSTSKIEAGKQRIEGKS